MTIPHHIARKSNDDDDLMKYIVDQIKININQKDSVSITSSYILLFSSAAFF